MNKISPDDVVEVFVSMLILLVGVAAFVEIYYDTSILAIVTELMKLLVYVFIFVFFLAVFSNMAEEL